MKRLVLGVLVLSLVVAFAWVPGCKSSARRTQEPAAAAAPTAPEPSGRPGEGAVRSELEELQARIALLEQERELQKGAPPAAPQPPALPQPPDPNELLQNAEEDAARSQEQSGALADGYYEEGRQFANAWKLKEAKDSLVKAVQVNPQHQKARELLDQVRQNLGEFPESEVGSRVRRMMEEAQVRAEQTRIEVENRFALGVKYYETEDFDKAIDEFKWVIELIKWNPPLDVEFRPRLQQTEDYLAKAREGKKRRDVEVVRNQEAASRSIAEIEEKNRRTQVSKEIDKRYQEAATCMEHRDFQGAEDLCLEILELDPHNSRAAKLKEFARAARHAQANDAIQASWIEEFRQEMNEMEKKLESQADIAVFDRDAWKNVISKRVPRGITKEGPAANPVDEAVRNRMKSTKISLAFTDAPLPEIIAFMREFTGLNIVIDNKSIPNPGDTRITLKVDDLNFDAVLSLIAKMHKLAYKIEDGVILIITEGDVAKDTVLELYDVQDMTVTIPDFPGPDLSLVPATEGGGGGVAVAETPQQQVTQEDLEKLIKNNIAKGTWETPPNSLTFSSGTLIVRHTPDVHSKIQKFLREVRASTGMIVNVEARFLTVSKHFLEDVGIDFRGLPTPIRGKNTTLTALPDGVFSTAVAPSSGIFDSGTTPIRARVENILDSSTRVATFFANVFDRSGGATLTYALLDDVSVEAILRAVRKDERSREVIAPRLTVFNNQRANIFFARQVTYIKDFNIEIAQQAAIAKPVPAVVQDGVVLDVRPTVSADRKYITMELRPTLAILKNNPQNVAGNTTNEDGILVQTVGAGAVRIGTPKLEVQRVKTTVTIPDEGTILVGGVGDVVDAKADSGVPFVNKIPILNFFFGERADVKQRKTLLVLIRAKLVLMEEEESKIH